MSERSEIEILRVKLEIGDNILYIIYYISDLN